MNPELQEFEQHLVQLIQHPPEPQYQQWQQVAQGRIVGRYFVSVGVAFHEDVDPGWYYVVEADFDHKILAEAKVEVEE